MNISFGALTQAVPVSRLHSNLGTTSFLLRLLCLRFFYSFQTGPKLFLVTVKAVSFLYTEHYIRTNLKHCSVPCTWLQTPCPRWKNLIGRLCKGICLKNKPAQEGLCHRLISKHLSRIQNRRVFSHSHKSNSSPDRRT